MPGLVLVTSRPPARAVEAFVPVLDAVHVLLTSTADSGPPPTPLDLAELVTPPPPSVVPEVLTAIEDDVKTTAEPYRAVAPSLSVVALIPPVAGRAAEGLHAVVDLTSQPVVPAGPRALGPPPERLTFEW